MEVLKLLRKVEQKLRCQNRKHQGEIPDSDDGVEFKKKENKQKCKQQAEKIFFSFLLNRSLNLRKLAEAKTSCEQKSYESLVSMSLCSSLLHMQNCGNREQSVALDLCFDYLRNVIGDISKDLFFSLMYVLFSAREMNTSAKIALDFPSIKLLQAYSEVSKENKSHHRKCRKSVAHQLAVYPKHTSQEKHGSLLPDTKQLFHSASKDYPLISGQSYTYYQIFSSGKNDGDSVNRDILSNITDYFAHKSEVSDQKEYEFDSKMFAYDFEQETTECDGKDNSDVFFLGKLLSNSDAKTEEKKNLLIKYHNSNVAPSDIFERMLLRSELAEENRNRYCRGKMRAPLRPVSTAQFSRKTPESVIPTHYKIALGSGFDNSDVDATLRRVGFDVNDDEATHLVFGWEQTCSIIINEKVDSFDILASCSANNQQHLQARENMVLGLSERDIGWFEKNFVKKHASIDLIVIPEHILYRDLSFSLMGVSSITLNWIEEKEKFMANPNIRIRGVGYASSQSLLNSFALSCTLQRRLTGIVTRLQNSEYGTTLFVLCDSIKLYLKKHLHEVSKLSSSFDNLMTTPSLIQLSMTAKNLGKPLDNLWRICQVVGIDHLSPNTKKLNGVSLLTKLHELALSEADSVFSTVFYLCLKHLSGIIKAWLFLGEDPRLSDPKADYIYINPESGSSIYDNMNVELEIDPLKPDLHWSDEELEFLYKDEMEGIVGKLPVGINLPDFISSQQLKWDSDVVRSRIARCGYVLRILRAVTSGCSDKSNSNVYSACLEVNETWLSNPGCNIRFGCDLQLSTSHQIELMRQSFSKRFTNGIAKLKKIIKEDEHRKLEVKLKKEQERRKDVESANARAEAIDRQFEKISEKVQAIERNKKAKLFEEAATAAEEARQKRLRTRKVEIVADSERIKQMEIETKKQQQEAIEFMFRKHKELMTQEEIRGVQLDAAIKEKLGKRNNDKYIQYQRNEVKTMDIENASVADKNSTNSNAEIIEIRDNDIIADTLFVNLTEPQPTGIASQTSNVSKSRLQLSSEKTIFSEEKGVDSENEECEKENELNGRGISNSCSVEVTAGKQSSIGEVVGIQDKISRVKILQPPGGFSVVADVFKSNADPEPMPLNHPRNLKICPMGNTNRDTTNVSLQNPNSCHFDNKETLSVLSKSSHISASDPDDLQDSGQSGEDSETSPETSVATEAGAYCYEISVAQTQDCQEQNVDSGVGSFGVVVINDNTAIEKYSDKPLESLSENVRILSEFGKTNQQESGKDFTNPKFLEAAVESSVQLEEIYSDAEKTENFLSPATTSDDFVVPISLVLQVGFVSPILKQCALIDAAAATLFKTQLNLVEHLLSIKRYMLMGQGDLFNDFVTVLQNGVLSGKDWTNPVTVKRSWNALIHASTLNRNSDETTVDDCFSYTVELEHPIVSPLEALRKAKQEIFQSEDTEEAEVLLHNIRSEEKKALKSLLSFYNRQEALEFILPEYSVKWPLGVVITKAHLRQLGKINRYLLFVKRMNLVGRETWFDMYKSTERYSPQQERNARLHLRWLDLKWHEIRHFLMNFEEYLLSNLLSQLWPKLIREINESLESPLQYHNAISKFVSKALNCCFLDQESNKSSKAVASCLSKMYQSILELNRLCRLYRFRYGHDTSKWNMESVGKAHEGFDRTKSFLLRALAKCSSLNQGSASKNAADLLMRLDFNGFYVN